MPAIQFKHGTCREVVRLGHWSVLELCLLYIYKKEIQFTHDKIIICRIEWREVKEIELIFFWTTLSVFKKAKMVEERSSGGMILTGEGEIIRKRLSKCHFVHHKSYMYQSWRDNLKHSFLNKNLKLLWNLKILI